MFPLPFLSKLGETTWAVGLMIADMGWNSRWGNSSLKWSINGEEDDEEVDVESSFKKSDGPSATNIRPCGVGGVFVGGILLQAFAMETLMVWDIGETR